MIGKDSASLLLAATHGKGRIVCLGGALTPQGRPAYREKQMVHDLSPLARALMKAGPGDRVLLRAPAGTEQLLILEVRYEPIATEGFIEPPGAESAPSRRT